MYTREIIKKEEEAMSEKWRWQQLLGPTGDVGILFHLTWSVPFYFSFFFSD
jgi:hypothetical protein